MSGSLNFIFHLFGFGILVTTLLAGWILERQQRKEIILDQKLYILSLSKKIGLLSPLAVLIMLVTGIINIHTVFGSNFRVLFEVGWLAAKIVLFAFLLVNGAVLGPMLSRKRQKYLESVRTQPFTDEIAVTLKSLNRNISTFYLVQWLLVILITFLSVFGTGKHAGVV